MSNNLLNISTITNEALMVLENDLTLASQVNRQYDDRYAVAGAKIGYTANVRKPARFKGTLGPALAVEDFNETYVPLTLSKQFHVDVQFTTADLALALDMFSDRVIKPAVKAVANKVDYDTAVFGYQNIANTIGTPGSPPASAFTYLQANALLTSEGGPMDNRNIVLDPWTMASTVDGLKGLFNPQAQLSEQYRKGLMGRNTLGWDGWYQDANIVSYTVGAQGGSPAYTTTGTSTALLTSGWADNGTLQTSGWTASANPRLNVGDVFTIGGVFGVNPQNRAAFASNRLRQFVVRPPVGTPTNGTFAPVYDVDGVTVVGGTYSSTAGGLLTLTIAPAIISAGQFQNVTAAPANNATITVLGGAATVSPQSLGLHKNCLALVMADLEMPGGVDFAGRKSDPNSGLSIRVVRQYTINNDALPTRFDVLYGLGTLYREMGVRIAG